VPEVFGEPLIQKGGALAVGARPLLCDTLGLSDSFASQPGTHVNAYVKGLILEIAVGGPSDSGSRELPLVPDSKRRDAR
jgi:hypothetical protein